MGMESRDLPFLAAVLFYMQFQVLHGHTLGCPGWGSSITVSSVQRLYGVDDGFFQDGTLRAHELFHRGPSVPHPSDWSDPLIRANYSTNPGDSSRLFPMGFRHVCAKFTINPLRFLSGLPVPGLK